MQRSEGDSQQPLYLQAQRLHHPPNLAVAPFGQHDFQPGGAGIRAPDARLRRPQAVAAIDDALAQRRKRLGREATDHVDAVDPRDMARWVQQPLRPTGVIRQQKQALGGLVQPAYRPDPREVRRQEIVNGAATALVAPGGHHAARFVQREVEAWRGSHGSAVQAQLDARHVDTPRRIELEVAVDGHPARANPFGGLASGGQAELGERPGQAHEAGAMASRHARRAVNSRRPS